MTGPTEFDSQLPPEDLIGQAWSPELFGQLASVWGKELESHLQNVSNRDGAVLNWNSPDQNISLALQYLESITDKPIPDRFRELLRVMLDRGHNLHHPRYIGHQVPASMPLAALFDAIGTVTNQVMAIYEMGPWSTAVEHAVVGKLCEKVGWNPEDSTGVLTHGGSLGNLTALLTARNVTFPDCWVNGIPDDVVLATHQDAHYSVARSAGILGLGTSQVVPVEVDGLRRMAPEALHETLSALQSDGRRVMAVSACACSTPTGAFDQLDLISDVCRRHNVWLHVDAAHGGAALMSKRHRHLLHGIDRADSVVWDAHKMLFMPALCAAVLYRDKAHRYAAFQQNAPYLFDPSNPGLAEYDSGIATIECTKRATGFGLWGIWSMFGDHLFEQLVDRTFEVAEKFHTLLKDAPDFQAMHEPQCNIIAFRFAPDYLQGIPTDRLNQLQHQLRTDLIRSGKFYIVQAKIDDLAALRTCIMNPLTTIDDMQELLDTLRQRGRKLSLNL